MQQRADNWQHAEGHGATVETIKAVFVAHRDFLVNSNLKIYDSDDMKVGRNIDLLVAAKLVIKELISIDPRGGYFAQTDIQESLVGAMDEPSQTLLLGHTHGSGLEVADVFHTIGYRLRVMLAHTRAIHDDFYGLHHTKRGRSHPMIDTIEYMHKTIHRADGARKVSRDARLKKRPNPFLNFRKADSDEEPAEEVVVVSRHFNPFKRKAEMLTSDGALHNADYYKEGPEGFIVAVWLDPKAEVTLEVANTHLLNALDIGDSEPLPKGEAQGQIEGEEEGEEEARRRR